MIAGLKRRYERLRRNRPTFCFTSRTGKHSSALECYLFPILLKASATEVMRGRGILAAVPFYISTKACRKGMQLTTILQGLFLPIFSALSLQHLDSADKFHLLDLRIHELLLKLHQRVRQIENSLPYQFFVSERDQGLTDLLNTLSAFNSTSKPIEHSLSSESVGSTPKLPLISGL